MNKRIAKIAALSVGLTLAVGVSTAGAQTVAELQAQINALLAQLAALQGGSSSAPSTACTFTRPLTLGTQGEDVSCLQKYLVAQGHLVMPAGVAYGYFGPLTQAAVAKWQAANGVSPAAGYFGPLSQAKYASMVSSGGGAGGSGSSSGGSGISTPGVEGTLTATLNSTPVSGTKVYEGDTRKAVLGIKLEAKQSDIKVERVQVRLPSSTFYNRVASRVYIMDGSNVLGSADLNSNTVVRESSTSYVVTVSGMNYVVPKDATRVIDVAFDFNPSIDTNYKTTYTITIPQNGIRGVDGAGINQYAPTSGTLSRDHKVESDLALSANLKISLNVNSPTSRQIIAASGVNEDEADGVELLKFDVRAEKDDVKIVDLAATTTGDTKLSTLYLYDGSTLLASESGPTGGAGSVVFSDIDYVVPKDTTRTLTIKADVRDVTSAASTTAVLVGSAGTVAENSLGDPAQSITGTAQGETMTFMNVGPEITLVSRSITKDTIGFAGATSTARATFNLQLRAVGGDVYFGPQASSTFNFQTYKGGVATNLPVASSTSWAIPSGVVTSGSGITAGGFKLPEGQSVNVPVDFLFEGRTTAGALISTDAYAVGLESVKWDLGGTGAKTTNFMSGKTEWRTTTVTMP